MPFNHQASAARALNVRPQPLTPRCRLIRVPIYPQLRDHPRVLSYPAVRGLSHPLFFLDHGHPEGGGGGASGEDRSKNNDWEARFVVALARHLLLQGYKPGARCAGARVGAGAVWRRPGRVLCAGCCRFLGWVV